MVNKVILVGNLGRDPEMHTTQAGKRIANLRVATSERWRDKNTGERKERTEWSQVVVFNENLAGVAEKYLRKGSKVYVEGQLQTRKWEDKNGVERWTTEVVLQGFNAQLELLDKLDSNRPPAAEDPSEYGATRTRDDYGAGSDDPGPGDGSHYHGPSSRDIDDDIPF